MLDRKHYVPILKSKAGELNALESAQGQGTQFTPLLELFRTDQQPQATIRAIRKAWQADTPIFIDALYIESPEAMGDTVIEAFSAEALAAGLPIIPVTGPGRSPAQVAAVGRVAAQHGHGACLRLSEDDVEEPTEIDGLCDPLVLALGLGPNDLYALIDLGAITAGVGLLRRLAVDAINGSAVLQRVGSLVVAGSAFPASMSGITAGVFTPVPRSEWTLWNAIPVGPNPPVRLPNYGDYAASHPDLVEFDPEIMTPAAKIAYTTDLDWLLLKGRSVKGPAGYGQFRQLAAQVVARPEFRGAAFSTGDNTLHQCAQGAGGTGNLATWVTVKTSHHLAHVVDQIANLP